MRAGFAEAEPGGSSVRNYGGAIEADGLNVVREPKVRYLAPETVASVVW